MFNFKQFYLLFFVFSLTINGSINDSFFYKEFLKKNDNFYPKEINALISGEIDNLVLNFTSLLKILEKNIKAKKHLSTKIFCRSFNPENLKLQLEFIQVLKSLLFFIKKSISDIKSIKKYENFSIYAKEKYKNFFYYFFLTVYYVDHVISSHYNDAEFFVKKSEQVDLNDFNKIEKDLIEFAKTIEEEDFFVICEKLQERIEELKVKENVLVTDFFSSAYQKIYKNLYGFENNSKTSLFAKKIIENPFIPMSCFATLDFYSYIRAPKGQVRGTIFINGIMDFFSFFYKDRNFIDYDKENSLSVENPFKLFFQKIASYTKYPSFYYFTVSSFLGISLYQFLAYVKRVGYFDSLIDSFKKTHSYLMGEKNHKFIEDDLLKELVASFDIESFSLDLSHETFSGLRKKGILNWFDQVVLLIDDLYTKKNFSFPQSLDRVILLTGESGNGKTAVVESFFKSLKNKINLYSDQDDLIEFYPLDPKHFNGPVLDRWKCPIDMLNELEKKLEEIKYKKKLLVIFFDEFHLYFTNDFGNLSQARVADFLKFFTTLKDKQKNSLGAMFVILSTNKEQLVPYELLKNPHRINRVLHIPNPHFVDRVELMKGYFSDMGIEINIDFEYLSKMFEPHHPSCGTIIHILKDAFLESKITQRELTTGLVQKHINRVLRKIVEEQDYIGEKDLSVLADYFSSIITASLFFLSDDEIVFDMATLYPRLEEKKPESMDQFFMVSPPLEYFYDNIFFINNGAKSLSRKRDLVFSAVRYFFGSYYLYLFHKDNYNEKDIEKNILLFESQMKEFFQLDRYFMAKDESAQFLLKLKGIVKDFFVDKEVALVQKIIKEMLLKNLTITLDDIKSNEEVINLIEKIKSKFNFDLFFN